MLSLWYLKESLQRRIREYRIDMGWTRAQFLEILLKELTEEEKETIRSRRFSGLTLYFVHSIEMTRMPRQKVDLEVLASRDPRYICLARVLPKDRFPEFLREVERIQGG